jgi:ABC-2 type transport system permease protein
VGRSLLALTWLEIKIFVREPLGVVGTIGMPVVLFIALGRIFGGRLGDGPAEARAFVTLQLPVFVAILIALSAVMSLVTIVSIYREGGILKRLRATPLRPATILTAHVIVKILFTAMTLVLMGLAGRQYVPPGADVPWVGFGAALLVSTVSILSLGFVIASLVPTARFAQPIGSVILYPMVALSGLFFPLDVLPGALAIGARLLPVTFAVSLLKGAWLGEPWSAHLGDLVGLAAVFVVCTALSAKVFRWE